MQKNNIGINNTYEDIIVPKGFYEWFMMLNKLKNKTHYEIEDILAEGDFFTAKIYFYEKTKYNKEKTWHED